MELTVAARVGAIAVLFPVRNAVDRVRIGFVGGALQTTPDKMREVIIKSAYFALDGKLSILGCEERRLGQTRVVAGNFINAEAADAVVIIRAKLHLALHVPLAEQPVVPLVRIAHLMGRDKSSAFVNQGLEGFRDKEFQAGMLPLSIMNAHFVFAEPGELDAVNASIAIGSQAFDVGCFRELRFDGRDFLPRSQREFGIQICRHGHAGHYSNINASISHNDLAHSVVIIGPVEFESVGL